MTRPNRSRPIRHRRTSAEMEEVRSAIYTAVAADHPMTVRQVFYRLVSQGVIAKTEAEYKATVVRQLGIIALRGHPAASVETEFDVGGTSNECVPSPCGGGHEALASAIST